MTQSRRTWSIRTHMVALVLAIMLSFGVFAAIALTWLERHEREHLEARLITLANYTSMAVDRELIAVTRGLQSLALSTHLETPDLTAFHERAVRTLAVHPGWEAILLVDPSGRQVMNTRVPFGSPLPQTGMSDLTKAVFATRAPSVSNLFTGPFAKRPLIALSVPIMRDGTVRYAMNLSASPAIITNILLRVKVPSDWVMTVVDRDQTIVGRTLNQDKFLGALASPMLAAKSREGGTGLFRSTTLEGTRIVAAYHRSELSGWTVAIGVPTEAIEAPLRRTLATLIVTALGLLVLGAWLALFIARRVTETYKELGQAAGATAGGETFSIAPLPIAEADQLAHAFSAASAQRRQAEVARRESEARLRNIFDQANDGIYLISADKRYLDVNARGLELLGYTREELLGMCVADIFAPPHETACREAKTPITIPDWPSLADFEHVRKDGSRFPAEVSVRGVGDGSYIAIVRDLTERRRVEERLRSSEAKLRALNAELEERVAQRTEELVRAKEHAEDADRLKSIFLSTMSHELRTPLNSIIGFTGIVAQELAGPLNEEQKKQLGMVRASARHLLELINDVLDISKIEAGEISLSNEVFDMRETIEKAVRSIAQSAAAKGLAVRVEIGPEVGRVAGDQRRVEQVLINLLNNAVKFTDRGEIKVACGQRDTRLVTSVSDTGIGIEPADMAKLFRPFVQVGAGLRRPSEGTGLGLSISKRLAELLRGTITAHSEYGVGSTFTFTLPLSTG